MKLAFFEKLDELLQNACGEIRTETVLSGSRAGRKYIYLDEREMFGGETEEEKLQDPERNVPKRVFREYVSRPPKLVICGGGHVSMPVIKLGKMLGFQVSVLEDRPGFADHARKAGADRVICEPFDEGLGKISGDPDTWFVIVTRGHRFDEQCLEIILKKEHAYIGMMGSKRRVAIVKEQLAERGADRELLERVHTPIGLKIGARTPEEIAVSVMAEIIQIKNGKAGSSVYTEELLSAVLQDRKKRKVLATIISRKGSAPRDAGTKMLVMEDGSTVDTIGGGCIENEIIRSALRMIKDGTPDFRICTVDMTADAAADEGMVCGGVVEVMLECIV